MTPLGSADRTVPAHAADAARALVEGSEALWRALPDGTLEVVKEGRQHKLYRIHPDGMSELVATSRRQRQMEIALPAMVVAGVSVFGSILTDGTVVKPMFIVLFGVAMVVCAICILTRQDAVGWVNERGLGGGWAAVPYEGTVAGATGNQLVAASRIAEGDDVSARRLEDGTVEVVKRGKLYRIAPTGETQHEARTPAAHAHPFWRRNRLTDEGEWATLRWSGDDG